MGSGTVCSRTCVCATYLCCLCDLVAVAERWAPGTLPRPLCHGRGRRGRCGCAGSGSSSCACCWWPRCPRGLTGEPAARRWIDFPGPGRAEDSLAGNVHSHTFIRHSWTKLTLSSATVLQWILPTWRLYCCELFQRGVDSTLSNITILQYNTKQFTAP